MKTRIISGVVLALLVVGVLALNSYLPITIVIVLSLLAAMASYEMLKGTKTVENKAAVIGACVYAVLAQFCLAGVFSEEILTFAYICYIIIIALVNHKDFTVKQITMSLSMPIILSYAFYSLASLLNASDGFGILYFILLINFSSVSDIFAYFVGSAIGKHKLAPVISPKKSVEGLIGGIIGSLVGIVIICLIFNAVSDATLSLWKLLIATPVFCLIGVAGDLFTSAIKRHCGIKDFGKIMPGHGGVLDRLDSVLLVAPALAMFLSFTEVIH